MWLLHVKAYGGHSIHAIHDRKRIRSPTGLLDLLYKLKT